MGDDKKLPVCKYGSKCYRKSKSHVQNYSHPDTQKHQTDEEPVKKNAKIEHYFNGGKKKPGDDATASGIADEEEEEVVNSETEAFKACLGLVLVGPYDILAGKCPQDSSTSVCYLTHYRYCYDPPEFLTIVKGSEKAQFHFGYYRDDPNEMPVFVASNSAAENCTLTLRGENIFAAINWFLEERLKEGKTKNLTQLKEKLTEWAKHHNFSLEQKTKTMKARDKKVVTKTFHGAGIVVPVDQTGVGYRPLPETTGSLKKILKKIIDSKDETERNKNLDPLMEIVMLIQFANDECDYGEGLELGLDLFSFTSEDCFHKVILSLLPLAYQFLNRDAFGKILDAHLANRKHTADLSVLD